MGLDVVGWGGLWVAGALGKVSQPDPAVWLAPRAYLEVHQLELEKLSTQIRESKRNSRLVSVAGKNLTGEWCFGQTAGVVGTAVAARGPSVPRGHQGPAWVLVLGYGAPVLLSCAP